MLSERPNQRPDDVTLTSSPSLQDFEEALIVDTESAVDGGRSSLIVDVLIALIRGCLGRRDVT